MEQFFMYKGYPLVRSKNTIYYGYMSDPFVIMMEIKSSKLVDNIDVADKIKVYQMSTDPKINPIQAIIKTSERESLYEAIDLARVWLDKALLAN